MDYAVTLKALVEAFQEQGLRFALEGGLALAALGAERSTRDIDFLIDKRDLPKLDGIMERLGYERAHRSEGFSQFRHRAVPSSWVDFQHAFLAPSLGMLKRAQTRPAFGGSSQVPVLQPEDMIGLKIQAAANDPERKKQDEADIEALMRVYGSKLDWARVGEYFELFGKRAEFAELRQRFDRAQ